MKIQHLIITIFLSFNVFANNMKPMQIAYFAKENKQYSFYTEQMSAGEIAAFEACHLSEKEINFFNDNILSRGHKENFSRIRFGYH